MDTPDPIESAQRYLETARKEFKAFYAQATERDSELMDGLIQTHAALVASLKLSLHPDPEAQHHIEVMTRSVENAFMSAREEVRASVSFRRLNAGEKARIEGVLFNPFLPEE